MKKAPRSIRGRVLALLRTLVILAFTVLSLLPFAVMLKSSFEPYARIVATDFHLLPDSLYLGNYRALLTDYPILRWMGNSFLVCLGVIAGNIVFDTFAAYALSRLKFKGQGLLFLFVMGSMIIPEQVVIVPLYSLANRLGWIDSYYALIIPFMTSAFGIFLLRQAYRGLPMELDEAAIIDGCNRVQVLFRVVLPNSLPSLATLIVIKFMWTWGKFLWPSLAINTELMRTLPVGVAYFKTSAATDPWDLTITGAVFLVVPIVTLYFLMQKYFVRGLTDGAIKE